MGALIARAICKKFTVSHTLLSGRPSRVCALPALRGHCADCGLCDTDGLCGLAGLRSPVFARGPFRRFAPTREPRCRERGGRGGARRGPPAGLPAPAAAANGNARNAPRPAGGHFAATGRPPPGRADSARADRTAATRDVSYARSRCAEGRTAAPNRRAGARRAATPDEPARRRIAGARGLTDDAPRSPAGRSRGSLRHDERRYGTADVVRFFSYVSSLRD